MICKQCETKEVKYEHRGRPGRPPIHCSEKCRLTYRSACRKRQRHANKAQKAAEQARLNSEASELQAEKDKAANRTKTNVLNDVKTLLKAVAEIRKQTQQMQQHLQAERTGKVANLDPAKIKKYAAAVVAMYELFEHDLQSTKNKLR